MTSDSENLYIDEPSHEDVSHQIISSYFIGPQAENLQFFKDNIATILEEQQDARLNYFPHDGVRSSRLVLLYSPSFNYVSSLPVRCQWKRGTDMCCGDLEIHLAEGSDFQSVPDQYQEN